MVATEAVDLMEDVTVARRDSDVTAWVNVIHGCNERCTYCVVPNTRGVEQSRWPHHIKVRQFNGNSRHQEHPSMLETRLQLAVPSGPPSSTGHAVPSCAGGAEPGAPPR